MQSKTTPFTPGLKSGATMANPWPPEAWLRQMLRDGTDTQVGELIDRDRSEIRYRRKLLGVPPLARGGSTTVRRQKRQAFEAK